MMCRGTKAVARAWLLALALSFGCGSEKSRTVGPAHAPPQAKLEVQAFGLAGTSPWTLEPTEVGALPLPNGLTPCGGEANDWLHDDLSLVITRCDGAVFRAFQLAKAKDLAATLCELTPDLKQDSTNKCPFNGPGIWRRTPATQSEGSAIFREGGSCIAAQTWVEPTSCGPTDPPYDTVADLVPRFDLAAPAIENLRAVGRAGPNLVWLDGSPSLPPNQVRVARADRLGQDAKLTTMLLVDGPQQAVDAPWGIAGRVDGGIAIAGPTGVWFADYDASQAVKVFADSSQGPANHPGGRHCCDIGWQGDLVGHGVYLLSPRWRPEIVILHDRTGKVVSTWKPAPIAIGGEVVAVRSLSVRTFNALTVFTTEEVQAGSHLFTARIVAWPLLGTARGASPALAVPGKL